MELQTKTGKKNLVRNIILWSISILLVGGIVISYFLVQHWKPIISSTIKESVYQSTDNLYKVDFDDIGLNLITGNVSIENLTLIPDMEVYKKLKAKKEQPSYLFNLSIEKLKLRGIHTFDFIKSKKLIVNEILLQNPDVLVYNDKAEKKISKDTSSFKNPYELIKSELKSLQIKQINLKDINLQFITDSLGVQKKQKIFLAYFKVRNLLVDSAAQYAKERPFYTDDIKVSIKNFSLPFKDSVNKMEFEEVVASTSASSIQAYNLKIIPLKSERKFSDTNGYRKTRIDLDVKEVQLRGINFKKLIYEQRLLGEVINITRLQSNIHINKHFITNPNKKIRFPIELVSDIKIPFHFDKVNIKKSELIYAETNKEKHFRWELGFNDLEMEIENFGNDSSYIAQNSKVKIDLLCKFNNKAKTKINFVFDYLRKDRPFFIKGAISKYKPEDLNPILSKMAKLELANCNLRTINFIMNGNDKRMHADITMLYNNLRIRILQFDEEESRLKRHGWFSMLANTLILSKDNPNTKGKFNHPKFSILREEKDGFFGFVWKALFKGIKESIGLTEQMESEIKYRANRIKEIKAFRQEMREERKERKEERKIKRDEKKRRKKEKEFSYGSDTTYRKHN